MEASHLRGFMTEVAEKGSGTSPDPTADPVERMEP